MAAGGPVDPTMPLPDGDRRGAPQPPETAEPTGTGALPGSYDPTVAVPPVGPPNEPGDPYGPGPGDGEEGDNRKWLWGLLAALGVIILGVVIALLVTGGDDGDNKPSTTSSSTSAASTSTSSSTTTSTTTATTTPNSPQITAYNAAPNPANCPNAPSTVQLTLTWTTVNALGVTVSIDGPGKYADYGANGSAQVPFPCSGSHSYTLTANGNNGQTATRTITVQPSIAPPATTTTTAAAPPSTTTTTGP
jgi:hypothetical protein